LRIRSARASISPSGYLYAGQLSNNPSPLLRGMM